MSSTTLIEPPAPTELLPTRRAARADGLAVTSRRVLRAEWIKLRSVRSIVIGLAAAVAVVVLFGLIFASVGTGGPGGPPGSKGVITSSVSLSLGGFTLAELVVGVLGVLIAASEYSTGLIRTTFAAVTKRVPVLWAKVATFGGVSLLAMTAASLVAFVGGQAVYGGTGVTTTLADPAALRAVLGMAIYTTGVGLLGLSLGFLLRSTASAIGVLLASLLLVPTLVSLLPSTISDNVTKLLPSKAAEAFTSYQPASDLLSSWAGALVFAAWVVGMLAVASALLRRRDA